MVNNFSFLDSLYVTIFGMAVVFVVLIGLNLMIRLQTSIFNAVVSRKTKKVAASAIALASIAPPAVRPPLANEKLRLINVDEKTAAIIMAIVCDESKIPPEELYFKSIVGMDEVTK